uniref:Uncharacterized protein n=1 Tax=Vitis vinifera TaxID=29760 RepID=F6HYJ3_VITVI
MAAIFLLKEVNIISCGVRPCYFQGCHLGSVLSLKSQKLLF